MTTDNIDEQVNQLLTSATADDSGKLTFPEGTDPTLAFAARAEKRRRDTQASYTKSQQKVKSLETENSKLAQSWEQDAVSSLSSTEQARLEELKIQDPDKWRETISNLETEKKAKFAEKREKISEESTREAEIARRHAALEQYNKENPDAQLTDSVIENDIPPRILRQLEKGDITFDDFLAKAKKYITTPKKIKQGEAPSQEPNFASARGSDTPSPDAFTKQDQTDYKEEIF